MTRLSKILQNNKILSRIIQLINLKLFRKAKDCSKDLVKLISKVMLQSELQNK